MAWSQNRNQEQQGHHGQILQQQDGKARPPRGRRQPALLGQNLDHDRRRRECQTAPDQDRRARPRAKVGGNQRNRHGGNEHLQAAEAEHQPAHRHQARRRQLEADQKEEKNDAQLADDTEPLLVADRDPGQRPQNVAYSTQSLRAQQHARQQ